MKKSPKMKITPLGERVLVRKLEADVVTKTASGIYIPETAGKELAAGSDMGEVVAIGDIKKIKVGDTVLFSKYGFDEIKVDGKEFLIIKEENILAIIK